MRDQLAGKLDKQEMETMACMLPYQPYQHHSAIVQTTSAVVFKLPVCLTRFCSPFCFVLPKKKKKTDFSFFVCSFCWVVSTNYYQVLFDQKKKGKETITKQFVICTNYQAGTQ